MRTNDIHEGLSQDIREAIEAAPETGPHLLELRFTNSDTRLFLTTWDALGYLPDRPLAAVSATDEETCIYVTLRTTTTLAVVRNQTIARVLSELTNTHDAIELVQNWAPMGLGAIEDIVRAAFGHVDLDRSPIRLDAVADRSPACPACDGATFSFPAELNEARRELCAPHATAAREIIDSRFRRAEESNPEGWEAIRDACLRLDGTDLPAPDPEAPLVREATRILAEKHVLHIEELTARLEAAGLLDDVESEERIDYVGDVLGDHDAVISLPDDRYADTATVLEGMTLTHLVTEEEARTGRIPLEPDLEPLVALNISTGFVFPDGSRVDLDDDDALAGPHGWLETFSGGLVAFRIERCGRSEDTARAEAPPSLLSVTAVEIEGPDRAAAAALADTFDEMETDYKDTIGLVIAAKARHPELLRTPTAPLSEIVRLAGLEQRGEWIGPAGGDWSPFGPREESISDAALVRAFDFEDCCFDALNALLRALQDGDAADPSHLAHGSVAEAFCARALDDDSVTLVEPFIATLADAARTGRHSATPARVRREALAAACFVLSACAERRGDALGAERLLTEALDANPSHGASLCEAARYAELRGDPSRALAYLRRAGVRDGDEQAERLAAFARPVKLATGRNQPCPCGSGRKYKACCAGGSDVPFEARATWLYEKAVSYAQRAKHRGLIMLLGETMAGEGVDAVRAALGEPIVAEVALFEHGLLESFCDELGPLLPPDELALARSWTGARRALWEVTRAGETLELLDVRTGAKATVLAMRNVEDGDLVWGRVVPLGAEQRFVGIPSKIPLRLREPLIALIDDIPDGFAILSWLKAASRPPELRTTDSEPTVFCRTVFDIDDPDAARDALRKVLEETEGDLFVDFKRDRMIRGTIRVDGSTLLAEATSEPRIERLQQTVSAAVPGARLQTDERTPFSPDMLPGEEPPDPDDLPPEVEAALEQHIAQYEERWVDESVPALGGLTPRQALDDPTRRGDLLALLKEFDSYPPLPGGGRGMDPNRLRELLGLPVVGSRR